MDEVCVLHVLGQTLQEAERLIENYWHSYLGEFLKQARGGAEGRCFFTRPSFESVIFMLSAQKAQENFGQDSAAV